MRILKCISIVLCLIKEWQWLHLKHLSCVMKLAVNINFLQFRNLLFTLGALIWSLARMNTYMIAKTTFYQKKVKMTAMVWHTCANHFTNVLSNIFKNNITLVTWKRFSQRVFGLLFHFILFLHLWRTTWFLD